MHISACCNSSYFYKLAQANHSDFFNFTLMKRFIQVFIAIIPLIVSFSTSDPTLHIRFLILGCVVGLLLIINLFTKKPLFVKVFKHPVIMCLMVILASFFVSTFVNEFTSVSIYILLKIFLSSLFGFLAIHIILENGFKAFLNSFVLFSLFLSAIYFFQFISHYSDIMSFEK